MTTHNRDIGDTTNPFLTRRGTLKLIAVTATGVFMPRAVLAQSADTSRLIAGNGVCTITPETTEGPFYIDPDLVRSDIREDREGVATTVRLQVVDRRCQPIPEARVDIWHCDAAGFYSGTREASGAGSDTFLRGTQIADADGIVTFQTIYPGWYPGRATHIHFKVFVNETDVLTGQIFFPDDVNQRVYREATAYSGRHAGGSRSNDDDFIARRAMPASLADISGGEERYVASLVIGIDPAA